MIEEMWVVGRVLSVVVSMTGNPAVDGRKIADQMAEHGLKRARIDVEDGHVVEYRDDMFPRGLLVWYGTELVYGTPSGKPKHLLKLGNFKLCPNVGIFNLPAVVTCPVQCPGCYAVKAEKSYQGRLVVPVRRQNLNLAVYHPWLFELVTSLDIGYLKHYRGMDIVRLHESGDFLVGTAEESARYIRAWASIARANLDVTFYTYTKVHPGAGGLGTTPFGELMVRSNREDLEWLWGVIRSELIPLRNFVVKLSIVPVAGTWVPNYGPVGYLALVAREFYRETGTKPAVCPDLVRKLGPGTEGLEELLKYSVLPAPRREEGRICGCHDGCRFCMTKGAERIPILFPIH